MLQFHRSLLVWGAMSVVAIASLAQEEPKPTPATSVSPSRDPNLRAEHAQERSDAEEAYKRSDHKKVIEVASAVLTENPKDHVALYLRGSSRIELGVANRDPLLVRSGIADAREAISVKQQDNFNYYLPYLYGMTNLAGLENKRAHAEVAVNFAGQLLAQPTLKGEERSNTLYQRALAFLAIQDPNRAIADYREAIRLTPNHLGALVGLADTLAATGQFAPAMNAYNEAVKAFPNLPLVYNNRGMFQQASGKLDEAVLDFSKALELDPQFAVALTNRGYVRLNQGKYTEAEADFTESLKLNAAQPMVLSLRAGSKLSRGDLEGAIQDYNEVLKWDTKNPVGHAELGFALFFSGKTQQALAEFNKTYELDSKARFIQPWRYLALLALDQKSQADNLFAADLAIPADKREWSDALLSYLAGRISEQDLRKSINTQDPKAQDAQNCEAEFFIGQRKFIAGQKDAAKVHFAAALKGKSTQLSAYRGAKLALK